MRTGGRPRHRGDSGRGRRLPGVIRSVSWKGDRAVRTGDGPGRGRRRQPAPDQRRPAAGGAREADRMGPSAPRLAAATGPATSTGPHSGRDAHGRPAGGPARVDVFARPPARSRCRARRRGPRRGCGCSSPRSVSSAARCWPCSRFRCRPPSRGNLHALDRHHQAVRTAHLVHRVDPDRPVGRLLRCRLAVVVGSGDPQPGPGHGPAVPLDRPGRRAHRGGRARSWWP